MELHIHQGDNSKILPIRPDIADDTLVIDNNWVCKQSVLSLSNEVIVAAKTVTIKSIDNLLFLASLSPEDTELLTVTGSYTKYKWVIELTNKTFSPHYYRREKHVVLFVSPGLIINS